MEFRHIEIGGILTVTAAQAIIERGKDRELVQMMRALHEDPFSRDADNAITAAREADTYGRSRMVIECIEKWRSELGPEVR